MRPQYNLYRLCLKLYPKSFRERYGEEMLLTLSDMLADQPTRMGRLAVWLRASAELPFSIVHENSNNVGERTMAHLAGTNNKKLLIGAVVLVAVILVAVFRIWLYNTAVPSVVGVFYRGGINKTFTSEVAAIGDPFTKISGQPANPTYICNMLPAPGIRMEVSCRSTTNRYVVLGQQPADKAMVVAAATDTTNKLLAAGYKGGDNGVTFQSLVAGTYEGKDYSPDAYYVKTVGDTACTIDTTVAYSNPKPAAINMNMVCERVVTVL